jgi:hypothetical protein
MSATKKSYDQQDRERKRCARDAILELVLNFEAHSVAYPVAEASMREGGLTVADVKKHLLEVFAVYDAVQDGLFVERRA